jgi:predicted Zn-ribbon and HTH transcriptional regulator
VVPPNLEPNSQRRVAEIFQRYGSAYAQQHPLRPAQRKAAWAIAHCRTAALGGHREWCPECGYERFSYHSCRNRHCPKCQSQATAVWVAARREELLPVPYFHDVFTLPHELNALLLWNEHNQRVLLDLLFDAASGTLFEFGCRALNGQIGFTLLLHTWDQQLGAHFHLHGLVPSGALRFDGRDWIAGGRQFLFPVGGLSRMFRARYVDGLECWLERGLLDLPPSLAHLAEPGPRRAWLRRLRRKPWVVYSKAPFAGPSKLVDYLGRYTHRVAIGNQRLVNCEDGQVTYRYRDRRDGDRLKTDVLPVAEFLRRFLQHILPDGFQRVRHYGLLANRGKRARLAHCRMLLGARPRSASAEARQTAVEWVRQVLGIDLTRCPQCGGELRREPLLVVRPDPHASYVPPPYPEFEAWNSS